MSFVLHEELVKKKDAMEIIVCVWELSIMGEINFYKVIFKLEQKKKIL